MLNTLCSWGLCSMMEVANKNVNSFISCFWSAMDGRNSQACVISLSSLGSSGKGGTLSWTAITLKRWSDRVPRSDVLYDGNIFLSQLSPTNWYFTFPLSAHESRNSLTFTSINSFQDSNFLWMVLGWILSPILDSRSMSYKTILIHV